MSTQTEPKLVTQIDFARAGQITPQMKEVAEREHRDPEYIRERVADGIVASTSGDGTVKKQPVKKAVKIGRNDPCPCGSGKKYKNCHGKGL